MKSVQFFIGGLYRCKIVYLALPSIFFKTFPEIKVSLLQTHHTFQILKEMYCQTIHQYIYILFLNHKIYNRYNTLRNMTHIL